MIEGLGLRSALAPEAVSGASRAMSQEQKMTQLFQQIDTDQTGRITKAQFEAAFQSMHPPRGFKAMGAEATFQKLDPNNTGSVSQTDFVNGMKAMATQMRATHHHRDNGASGASNNGSNPWTSPSATLADSLQSLLSAMSKQG